MRKWGIIWWLWTAFSEDDPAFVQTFECDPEGDDLAWLGEGGWVYASDNLNLGLRTVRTV